MCNHCVSIRQKERTKAAQTQEDWLVRGKKSEKKPCIILYTSGSTGAPKVLHSLLRWRGAALGDAMTDKTYFDREPSCPTFLSTPRLQI